MLILILGIILLFSLLLIDEGRKTSSYRESTEIILRTIQKRFNLYQSEVIKLCSIAKLETLKSVEQELEYYIKRMQNRDKVIDKVMPFVAISVVVLFLNFFQPINAPLDKGILYEIIKGAAGLVTITTVAFNVVNAVTAQNRFNNYNDCIYVLKKAQALKSSVRDNCV